MKSTEIIEKLYIIYCDTLGLVIDKQKFVEAEDLSEEFSIDSLMGLQIIVRIEQEFEVIIEDDDFAIEMIKSLDKAVNFIEKAR